MLFPYSESLTTLLAARSIGAAAALLLCLFSCSSVKSLKPELTAQTTPFLHDGITTAREIEGRLGPQYDSYDGGRIKIYQVSFDKYERLTLSQGWPCHALILVFDDKWILQRHGLVENGCGERAR